MLDSLPPRRPLISNCKSIQEDVRRQHRGRQHSKPQAPKATRLLLIPQLHKQSNVFSLLPQPPSHRRLGCSSTHPDVSVDVVHLAGDLLEEQVAGLAEAHGPSAAHQTPGQLGAAIGEVHQQLPALGLQIRQVGGQQRQRPQTATLQQRQGQVLHLQQLLLR